MRKFTTIALLACGLLCGCPEKGSTGPTAPPANNPPADTKPADTKAPETAPKAGESTPPADSGAKTEVKNFWKDAGVGTVAEYKMTTDMTKPMAMKTETTQKQTLTAKDDKGYTLKTEMTANGMAMPATETKMEWAVATGSGGQATAAPQDLGNEKVTVGAGSYDCKHYKTTSESSGMKTTSETWMMDNLVVKMVATTEGASSASTTTMELTKLEKK